jgi:hypothetical protein
VWSCSARRPPEQWAKTRAIYAGDITNAEAFLAELHGYGWTADMLIELADAVRQKSLDGLPLNECLFEGAIEVRGRRGYA